MIKLFIIPRNSIFLLVAMAATFFWAGEAFALDPFSTENQTASSQATSLYRKLPSIPCTFEPPGMTPLSLADVVERALCNNPQTKEAWTFARIQAAQVGVAQAAYLPTLSAAGTANWYESSATAGVTSYNQQNASISLSYLLYDFGLREANVESARQILTAANATQDNTLQIVFLAAVSSYYQLLANEGAVDSTKEAERSAQESLNAATARHSLGVATLADKLQAQTAYSQAVLNRIQAEGNARISRGVLADSMGMAANESFVIAPPAQAEPTEAFEQNVDKLIQEARKKRPDLMAAEAQVNASKASLNGAKAAGLPSLSISSSFSYVNSSIGTNSNSFAYGASLSIPIFTGFSTTYKIRAAEEQLLNREATRQRIGQQVALDVWRAYQTLVTQTQAVKSSNDLVISATQSHEAALGRYKAGVGNILDLLTAQSTLASARLQNIQALYNWQIARATLAQAIGTLDFTSIAEDSPNH